MPIPKELEVEARKVARNLMKPLPKKPLKVIAGSPERPLSIGEVEIQAYVLEDETRVLSQRGLQLAIGMSRSGGTGGAHRIARFIEGFERKGLEVSDLSARMQLIEFQPPTGRTAYGYQATLLVDLCNLILKARDAGVLFPSQMHIAERAEVLIRALAGVAIIALVDEATGYERIREERALATILEKFIAKEMRPWMQAFPYEYYHEIFRLKGWKGPHGVKRPSVLGHYTNDFVYKRLAPGLLEELRKVNPTTPSGGRSYRHHQWFTADFGHPKLREHLIGVTALMRAAPNWNAFKRMLDRAYPKWNESLQFPFTDGLDSDTEEPE